METGNFTCNSQFVVNSLQKALDSVIVSFTKVNLIITDAVSYNLAVKKQIILKYPNIFWITCFSHLLHNCCSQIIKFYPNEDKFMTLINDFVKRNPGKEFHYPINAKPPEIIPTR